MNKILNQHYLIENTDWDTLLVLDACRHDMFEAAALKAGLKGRMCFADSEATDTDAWYKRHWTKSYNSRTCSDVALVTATPVPLIGKTKDAFWIRIKAWKKFNVDPNTTIDYYRQLGGRSKAVIHFIPPHLPFIGREGNEFIRENSQPDSGTDILFASYGWMSRQGKKLGWSKLKHYYKENLELVLRIIKTQLSVFKGRVVITADHGELIGEDDIYGHSGRLSDESKTFLSTVPWLELEAV